MKTTFLIIVLAANYVWAEVSPRHYHCTIAEQQQTMLPSFELTLDPAWAQITTERGMVIGSFNPHYRSRSNRSTHWIQYRGFADILREYDTTLLVPISAFTLDSFRCRLVGRGGAYYVENYQCELRD